MLKTGTIIAERYEILGKIGTGGMADVYKAKDHKLNRFVAVKVLKPEFREDTTFIRKFRSEAQAAAGLTHPNIVNVSFFRRGKVLVPYVDYKFKKSSISQIVMNPYNCEDSSMMELGIQELLTMNGLDNVKICHSNIPLRRYD